MSALSSPLLPQPSSFVSEISGLAVSVEMAVLWVVAHFSLVEVY